MYRQSYEIGLMNLRDGVWQVSALEAAAAEKEKTVFDLKVQATRPSWFRLRQ